MRREIESTEINTQHHERQRIMVYMHQRVKERIGEENRIQRRHSLTDNIVYYANVNCKTVSVLTCNIISMSDDIEGH